MRMLAVLVCISVLLLAPLSVPAQQQMFERAFTIAPPSPDWGWGNAVVGVDFDGDGLLEIYAVNNNMYDAPGEMVPAIFKYELNAAGTEWNIVWSDTLWDIPSQNTWPALTYGDWDQDGKMEIIWGPVNNTAFGNTNPDRIIVYEAKGDGSDVMGVDDGAGGYRPNARWQIDTTANYNLRPFRWELHDIDGDGALELIFCDRASSTAGVGYKFGVVSVSDIPDNGDGSETWTLEASGKDLPTAPNTVFDMAVLDSTAYFFHATTAGYVSRIRWRNGEYIVDSASVAPTPLSGPTLSGGFKNVQLVDIDGDGTKEMIGAGYGGNSTNRIWIVQVSGGGDDLVGTELFDPTPLVGSVRLLGSAAGDIDNDGNLDVVFGSYNSPSKAILRVEYKGSGSITDPANYDFTILEHGSGASGVRYDFFSLFNMDADPELELLYGSGYGGDYNTPMTILNKLPGTYANVTFQVNTATVPDTLISSVTVTGDKAAITNWGDGFALSNVGGDYWKGTTQLKNGDSVRYKIRVNGAWEANPLDPNGLSGDNRGLIVGDADTTVPLQFFNNVGNGTPQYFRPWTAADPDTFMNVYFRVNTEGWGQSHTPQWWTLDTMGVRGGGKKNGADFEAPELAWGTTHYLTRDTTAANGGFSYNALNFWSGRVRIRKDAVTPGDSIYYKFIVNGDWGRSDPNDRFFRVPVDKNDTTLHWVWFTDTKPIARANTDTCVITFRTNMARAISRGGFSIGDTIEVETGYFATAVESPRPRRLLRQGITTLYQYTDTVVTKIGSFLDYQYYVQKLGIRTRENYFNFQFSGTPGSNEQERRQILVPSNAFTILDTASSISEGRRMPEFANQQKLTKGVAVKWVVDMRPAYYQVKYGGVFLNAIQGPDTVSVADSVFAWGVAINGPATGGPNGPLASDWATWNRGIAQDTSQRKMWDDGTHGGDLVAGDSLFTVTFRYTTNNIKGQVFKFGIRGSDNESGFGLNHLENISDLDTTYTIDAQWGSINPNFYNMWDYDARAPKLTGVEDLAGVPLVYSLEQNYPNPFNPSTKIEFSIPATSPVELKVYTVLGQEVATLVNETLKVGKHAVRFDASQFASGVYFYRIIAGDFISTKKMLLLK
jgi:hypothetical protein